MSVRVAQIIFNNTPSRHNKDLTDFLKRNLKNIIERGNIRFQFKKAESKDFAKLKQRNINALPAMIIRGQPAAFIGVPYIVETLRRLVKTSRKVAAPKSEEEILHDYQQQEMSKNVSRNNDGALQVSGEDDEWDNPDLSSKFQKELDRRKEGGYGVGADPSKHYQPKRRPETRSNDSFDILQDDSFEPAPAVAPREDNLEIGDPMRALNNIAPSRNKQDDDMMKALLERMGGDETGF